MLRLCDITEGDAGDSLDIKHADLLERIKAHPNNPLQPEDAKRSEGAAMPKKYSISVKRHSTAGHHMKSPHTTGVAALGKRAGRRATRV